MMFTGVRHLRDWRRHLVAPRGLEMPQGRTAGPALHVLNDLAPFVRDPVKLAQKIINFCIGGAIPCSTRWAV